MEINKIQTYKVSYDILTDCLYILNTDKYINDAILDENYIFRTYDLDNNIVNLVIDGYKNRLSKDSSRKICENIIFEELNIQDINSIIMHSIPDRYIECYNLLLDYITKNMCDNEVGILFSITINDLKNINIESLKYNDLIILEQILNYFLNGKNIESLDINIVSDFYKFISFIIKDFFNIFLKKY